MSISHPIQWKRLTAEGAAIVAGILLAFWIDAWWDERQESKDERVILSALLGEFQTLNVRLAGSDSYYGAIRESTRQLFVASQDSANDLTEQDLDELMADLLWYANPSVVAAPELESAISSGGLSLISKVQLRQLIGKWPAHLDTLKYSVEIEVDFHYNRFLPFLREHAQLAQLFNADDGTPGTDIPPDPYWERTNLKSTKNHSEVLSQMAF